MNVNMYVVLVFSLNLVGVVQSNPSWLSHLKKCLLSCYTFNEVLIIIPQRNTHNTYLVNKVVSEISNNSDILLVPEICIQDRCV